MKFKAPNLFASCNAITKLILVTSPTDSTDDLTLNFVLLVSVGWTMNLWSYIMSIDRYSNWPLKFFKSVFKYLSVGIMYDHKSIVLYRNLSLEMLLLTHAKPGIYLSVITFMYCQFFGHCHFFNFAYKCKMWQSSWKCFALGQRKCRKIVHNHLPLKWLFWQFHWKLHIGDLVLLSLAKLLLWLSTIDIISLFCFLFSTFSTDYW